MERSTQHCIYREHCDSDSMHRSIRWKSDRLSSPESQSAATARHAAEVPRRSRLLRACSTSHSRQRHPRPLSSPTCRTCFVPMDRTSCSTLPRCCPIRALPPASVAGLRSSTAITCFSQAVEELVANSIDAGATVIDVSVRVEEGFVAVSDNGRGMDSK